MNKKFSSKWIMYNALGMSIGFVAFIQLLHFLAFGLDFEKHWDFNATDTLELSPTRYSIYIGTGLAFFGAIISAFQANLLKQYISRSWQWVLNGAIGYLLMLLIIFPLRSIWGKIEGPVEPFALVLGGTLFMLILQWRLLKKQGFNALKPLLLYILGIILGLVILFILFFLGLDVPWALEVFIIGLICGASAGFISAGSFGKILVK